MKGGRHWILVVTTADTMRRGECHVAGKMLFAAARNRTLR